MLKKYLFLLSCLIASFMGAYLFYSNGAAKLTLNTNDCPFCDRKLLERQKIYENEVVIALYTHKPILPGHVLVIPKRHIERLEMLTDQEMVEIHSIIKKVHKAVSKVFGTSSYLILQKNGKEVGQSVPHVHFHYIPRKIGDDSILKFLFSFYISNFRNPIQDKEMNQIVQQLKNVMGKEELLTEKPEGNFTGNGI